MNIAIASASSPGAAAALLPARAPLSASVQRRLDGYSYDGSYYYSTAATACARVPRGVARRRRVRRGVQRGRVRVRRDRLLPRRRRVLHGGRRQRLPREGGEDQGGAGVPDVVEQIPWHHEDDDQLPVLGAGRAQLLPQPRRGGGAVVLHPRLPRHALGAVQRAQAERGVRRRRRGGEGEEEERRGEREQAEAAGAGRWRTAT